MIRWTDNQSEFDIEPFNADLTSDERYAKAQGAPIKTEFGEIHKGFDRDTGNEIMWRVINIAELDKGNNHIIIVFEIWLENIKKVTELDCQYLLKYFLCEKKSNNQIILISEMISRGSLSSYLTVFKYPRLTVCQSWFQQILEGLQYLHSHNIAHGCLTSDHIYINSNIGELKIGDLCLVDLPDVFNHRIVSHQPIDDIHYFGLMALEIAFAQILSSTSLKKLKKRIHNSSSFNIKEVTKFLKYITDPQYKSLIQTCILASPTTTIKDILDHQFFVTTRDRNENMRGIIKPLLKKKTSKSKLSISTNGKNFKVLPKIRINIINVTIEIRNQELSMTINFKYNMNYDNPKAIANELRESLLLPEDYIVTIHSQICNAIQKIETNTENYCKAQSEKKTEDNFSSKKNIYYNTVYIEENVASQKPHHESRQPSISDSISPIETCSGASINTNNTIMEHIRAFNIKNPMQNDGKIFSSREDQFQPEVAYSDIQQSPRDCCDDEPIINGMKKEIYCKKTDVEKECNGNPNKKENMSENEDGDLRTGPRI